MAGISQQRARHGDALALSAHSAERLQPLHDDLATISPSYDGIVYFAKDQWHENNASAVATVQPESADTERFAFYKENIAYRRVDLGATALGEGLAMRNPGIIKSRMNPKRHTTYTERALINDSIAGGFQAAFNTEYGNSPSSTRELEMVFKKHKAATAEVAQDFYQLSQEVDSIGDVLENNAPATSNGIQIGWDTINSTNLALNHYGALRNYLLDAKRTFVEAASPRKFHVHDTGDGQDLTFWLPTIHEGFDRSNEAVVGGFGKTQILPLVRRLVLLQDELAESYKDIDPKANFAVGLGYIEHDRHDEYTSQGYWKTAKLLKTHPTDRISYTPEAARVLGIQKTPQ